MLAQESIAVYGGTRIHLLIDQNMADLSANLRHIEPQTISTETINTPSIHERLPNSLCGPAGCCEWLRGTGIDLNSLLSNRIHMHTQVHKTNLQFIKLNWRCVAATKCSCGTVLANRLEWGHIIIRANMCGCMRVLDQFRGVACTAN